MNKWTAGAKWTNGQTNKMDDVVGSVHLFENPVQWLGGQKSLPTKNVICAEELSTKNGQVDIQTNDRYEWGRLVNIC